MSLGTDIEIMTTPLLLQDAPPAAVRPTIHRPPVAPPATVAVLPERFDAHAVERWVRPEPASHQSIEIDAGAVRFLDAAGLEALQELVDRSRVVGATLRIRNVSQAAALTMQFCQTVGLLEVAE